MGCGLRYLKVYILRKLGDELPCHRPSVIPILAQLVKLDQLGPRRRIVRRGRACAVDVIDRLGPLFVRYLEVGET